MNTPRTLTESTTFSISSLWWHLLIHILYDTVSTSYISKLLLILCPAAVTTLDTTVQSYNVQSCNYHFHFGLTFQTKENSEFPKMQIILELLYLSDQQSKTPQNVILLYKKQSKTVWTSTMFCNFSWEVTFTIHQLFKS